MRSNLKDRESKTPKRVADNERGQTLVEYVLILLFVSTALVLTLSVFASDLKGLFETVIAGI